MLLRSFFWACVAVACLRLGAERAVADSPWQRANLFKKLEADPTKVYRLSEQQGPWLILATTFTGETAEEDAQKLVYELRATYKLPAYLHPMDFKFDPGQTSRRVDNFGQPLTAAYRRKAAHEVAVLVGDFSSLDDPQAKRVLEKLRYLTPDCLTRRGEEPTWSLQNRTLAGMRAAQLALSRDKEGKPLGPLSYAFITSNPLISADYFKPRGLDSLVVDLNKPLKHSLIHCPGKYSVRVATFGSPAIPIIGNDKKKEAEATKLIQGTLVEAGEKAHRLTEALRKRGFEAWEFHDRTSSMVCVGSFDSVGTPRADGKTEINPQIHQIMETFGAEKTLIPGQPPQVGQPKKDQTTSIPFDVQPLPVEVPRATISAAYGSR